MVWSYTNTYKSFSIKLLGKKIIKGKMQINKLFPNETFINSHNFDLLDRLIFFNRCWGLSNEIHSHFSFDNLQPPSYSRGKGSQDPFLSSLLFGGSK